MIDVEVIPSEETIQVRRQTFRVGVYGSLRKTMGNHRMMEGATYLGTEVIKGWNMFSLGSFPYVTRGKGQIVIELYDVPASVINPVDRMEFGAGYVLSSVDTTHGIAEIYSMNRFTSSWPQEPVPSGDWVEYYNAQEAERNRHHENHTH